MPEPITPIINPANPNPANPGEGGKGGEGGNDPTKTVTTPPTAFDTSKVGDEDFQKIFDDPRLWKHPRFKTLNDRAKKADDYEAEKAKADEEALKKKGEFETLANKAQQERDQARTELANAKIDNRIQTEATKAGVVDLEAVLKLIDRANIKVSEDGSMTGIEEAVKALLEAKPYLKGKGGATTLGTPTNPGANTDGIKKFTLSQIQDPVFYRANQKDIQAALKAGLVEDDMHQGQK